MGTEAIEHLSQSQRDGQRIDAAILDLTIPGKMGGKEAVGRLRQIDSRIKVLVSSGYSNDTVLSNHRTFGFDGMISKPYTLTQLSHVLHTVINGMGIARPSQLMDHL